ncbi:MAG: ABC transporter ATP-binding protein [Oscillospiraceae bacterium]|nr:ABC transporter ATP-binding protein [Oscillospiraceae bacterium]
MINQRSASRGADSILEIRGLHTSFFTSACEIPAVRGVDIAVRRGECLGVVGESGSGKSVTFLSALRLLASTGRIKRGEIIYGGHDLTKASASRLREVRGGEIAMIFQDPMSSLNPLMTIGAQIGEMIRAHGRSMNKNAVDARTLELLSTVLIPEPEKRLRQYPHEFSGGMRQRAMIAMALACKPSLLIADEPTTALDVSIQDQILKLLRRLQTDTGMSIVFITHDLGAVAELCTRVVVMYAGLVMEESPIEPLFDAPLHPYTRGLLASIPGLSQDRSRRLIPIPGSPPDMSAAPDGCPFAPRCEHARNICLSNPPALTPIVSDGQPDRLCRCWLYAPDAPRNPLNGGFLSKAAQGVES